MIRRYFYAYFAANGGEDMAEIDSLEIQITAESNKAKKSIDSLSKSLGLLSKKLEFETTGLEKLENISGTNFKNLGAGVKTLSSGLKNLQGVKKSDFNRIAAGVERLSKIQVGNMEAVGNSLIPLAQGINILSNSKFDNKNLQNLINSLTRLSNSNLGNLESANFTKLGTSVKDFANAVSGAKKVEQSTISMTNAVAKLASAGRNIGKATGALPHLANNLKSFMATMHEAPEVSSETTALTQAIASLANAGSKTKETANNLEKLGEGLKKFIKTMSDAPEVRSDILQMTSALSGLANQGGKVSISASSMSGDFGKLHGISGRLGKGLKNLTGIMSGLRGSASGAATSVKSITSGILSAAKRILGAVGMFELLKKSIDISSDLAEVQNVVNVTFGDMSKSVEDFSQTSIEKFGLSELAAKQYSSTFQAMGSAMKIDPGIIGAANSFLEKQTNGYIKTSDSMSDVSLNLTKLTADMASFYNMEQKAVAEDLASIFTGTVDPLQRYGLNLTQATLSEWAMKQGLDADIRSMSAAEQTMLRYQYVLANTTAAQGDFSRTADSWANSTRVLVQQLEILGSIVGGVLINAFKPFVNTLNVVMSKVISFAKTVADALGTIFGWTFEVNPGGITNDGFEDMSSGIEDVADSAGDAAKNVKDTTDEVKDLKANLQRFDKLNVISLDKDKDKGKDKGKGKGKDKGTGLGGIGGLDTNLFETESVLKKYKSSIDSLYKLGDYIGKTLTKALNSIKWKKVYAAADNFGIGLAQFLNGLISPELFSALGDTIAGALNTALHALDSFGETFDWKNLGDSLSAGLVAFLKGIDWKTALSAAANWGTGIATTLNSFISPESFGMIGKSVAKAINVALKFLNNFGTTFDWSNFGRSLGTGINKFLTTINWKKYLKNAKTYGKGIADAINSFLAETDFKVVGQSVAKFLNGAIVFAVTSGKNIKFKTIGGKIADGLNGFFKTLKAKELAEAINEWVKGALDTATTLLKKTDFKMIGQKIGTFLAELDFLDVMGKIASAIWEALKGAFDLLSGMITEAPIETALIAAFGIMKFTKVGSAIASSVSKSLASNMSTKLGTEIGNDSTIGSTVQTALEGKFSKPIQNVVDKLGSISGAVSGAATAFLEFESVSDSVESLATGTGNFVGEIGKIGLTLGPAVTSLTAAFGFPAGTVVAAITGAVGTIKGINDAFEKIEAEKFGKTVHDALAKPDGIPISDIVSSTASSIEEIGNSFSTVREKSNELSTAKENIKSVVSQIDKIKTSIEAGVISSEDGCKKLNKAYSELADAINIKIGAAGDALLSVFGADGMSSKAFEAAGINSDEMKKKVVSSMDESQKQVYKLTERLIHLRETDPNSDKIPKLEERIRKLSIGVTDADKALDDLSVQLDTNKLNWEDYLNEDGFDTEKFESGFESISKSVSNARQNVSNDVQVILDKAREFGDESIYEEIKSGIPDAIDYMNGQVDQKALETTNKLQSDLIGGIDKVVEDAQKEWSNKNWFEKWFSGGSEANYVKKALADYKKNYVDPASKQIEASMSEVGVEGAAWASDAMQKITDSLFEKKEGDYNQTTVSLKSDWKEILDNVSTSVSADASKSGKGIGKYITDGLSLGIDLVKAAKNGDDLGDAFLNSLKKKWGIASPSKVMKEMGEYIVEGFLNGLKGNWGNVEKWWKTNAKLPKIKASIEDLKKVVAAEWKKVTNYWKKKWLEIGAKFTTNQKDSDKWWKKVKEWWGDKKKLEVSNKFKTNNKDVDKWWSTLKELWGTKQLKVNNKFTTKESEVKNWWSTIKELWGTKQLKVNNAFVTKEKEVKSWWRTIKEYWGKPELAVRTKYVTEEKTINNWGEKTVKWLKAGISAAWTDFSNWFTGKMKSLMNGAIKGMNWVLKGVGSKTTVPAWPGYAKGANGLPRDEIGIVNDQKGRTYKELIVPPKGKPFIPDGRNVVLPLQKGTKILPARKTKQLLSDIPHFASGIGDFSGSVLDYIDRPKEILKIGIDKHMDLSGLKTPIYDMASSMKNMFVDAAEGFVKKIFDTEATAGVEGAVRWALKIAADDSHGYDQNSRWGYPDYDCSSLVISAFEKAGIKLKSAGATYTGNMYGAAKSVGFTDVTKSVSLATGAGLKRGDILLNTKNHTAIYTGNGRLVNASANEHGGARGGTPGDQTGREIYERGYYNYPWDYVLRFGKRYKDGAGRIKAKDIIQGYASGGFPMAGHLFMARENGIPEMVGKIGGHAAVANNSQITKAISEAIYKRMKETTQKVEAITNKLSVNIDKSLNKAAKKSGADQKTIGRVSKEINKGLENAVSGIEKEFLATGKISDNEINKFLQGARETIEQAKNTNKEIAGALDNVYKVVQEKTRDAFSQIERISGTKKKSNEKEEKSVDVKITQEVDTDAYEAGQQAGTEFSDGAKNYISGMQDWVNDMRSAAERGFTDFADKMKILGSDTVISYDSGIEENYDDLDETIDGMAGDLAGGFSDTEYEMQVNGENAIASLNLGMSEKWAELSDWAKNSIDALVETFGSMKEGMYAAGEGFVSGLLEGMNSLWESLVDTTNSMKAMIESVKDISSKGEGGTESKTKKAKFSDAISEKVGKLSNYKVADFSPKQSLLQGNTEEKHFVQAGRKDAEDSMGRDLMNGISIGVADAVNKVLVPALESERNLRVELKGDAGKIFSVVQDGAEKYKTITGRAPF